MTKRFIPFGIALLMGIACAGNQNGSMQLKKGTQAPDFTARDQAGETITLSELTVRGPVVLSLLRGFS